MFYYLVTAHFLLTQTIKYSYQCINLSKTQNDSNTPFNLTALLKVNKIYFLTHKYTYVVISMTGRFSTDYTSRVHVMIGKKPVQQSITKTKWFEVPCPHDLLPHSNPPHFELYIRYFFSSFFYFFRYSVRIFLLLAFTV